MLTLLFYGNAASHSGEVSCLATVTALDTSITVVLRTGVRIGGGGGAMINFDRVLKNTCFLLNFNHLYNNLTKPPKRHI